MEEYEEAVEDMKVLYQEGKRKNKAQCRSLMDITRSIRRDWINKERPQTVEVFEKFPLLYENTLVSIHLTNLHTYSNLLIITVQDGLLPYCRH